MNTINGLLGDIRLRFNIDHPSIEECYSFGYECSLSEMDESENPFQEGTVEYDQWQDGWWAGFYGEKPLFEMKESFIEERKPVIEAANDGYFQNSKVNLFNLWLKITGAIAASAVIGYQVIDLVA